MFFDNIQVLQKRGAILEETDYYPFGLTMSGISSKAAGSIENKKKYNGKELQSKEFSDGSGLELYDYGARMQDPQIARWHKLDALSDSMKNFSPYNFSFNNPIKFLDRDGNRPEDIIVLNNPKGASGYGHTAILIGNDKTGWTFISKEGRDKTPWYSNEFTGGPSLKKVQTFTTLGDFKKSQIEDKDLKGYTQSVRFQTAEQQDKEAIKATDESADSWYSVIANNCADAVSAGLKAIKLDPGYKDVIGAGDKTGVQTKDLPTRPSERFEAIKENNKSKIIQ